MVQINTQENHSLAERFAVRSVPVILLLQNGRVIGRLPGAQTVEAVLTWFKRAIGSGL